MPLNNYRMFRFVDGKMRGFLINKNLSLYYWLKKGVGKTMALRIASGLEGVILIFGREEVPSINQDRVTAQRPEFISGARTRFQVKMRRWKIFHAIRFIWMRMRTETLRLSIIAHSRRRHSS